MIKRHSFGFSMPVTVQKNISLQPFNTFGIDVKADLFVRVKSIDDFRKVFQSPDFKNVPKMILGGGSNVLLTKDFQGLIIKNEIGGIKVIHQDNDHVKVHVGAGVIWHEFVLHCIENNWAGVENLSLIPGCVGASPMQNIGAYGVEAKDVIEIVHTIELAGLQEKDFTNPECKFGYRESIFKKEAKDKYCITGVTFQLKKKPAFNISYGAIKEELEKEPNTPLSIRKISDAIIRIRQSKLPDPAQIGNAGSFFKNPEITKNEADILKKSFPEAVIYPVSETTVKVAAGWLIEKAGWKGYRENEFGVHAKQALVLVNYGHAKGSDLLSLSEQIIKSVKNKFNIDLVREVNII